MLSHFVKTRLSLFILTILNDLRYQRIFELVLSCELQDCKINMWQCQNVARSILKVLSATVLLVCFKV